MGLVLATILALFYNVGLYCALRLDVAFHGTLLRHCRWFQWMAICGIFLFDGNAVGTFFSSMGQASVFMMLPYCGILALSLLPFVLFMIGEGVDAVRKGAMSDGNIKVARTYDQAEAAVKQKDFARAETLLREAIEEDPHDPEPHRRVADLFIAKGDVPGAIRELRQAAALTKDPEPRTVTLFRIVDLLAERANDPEAAEAAAKGILYEYKGTKYAEMAQARLDRLAQRARPPVG